jgi:DNA-binding response OmpR family regulator
VKPPRRLVVVACGDFDLLDEVSRELSERGFDVALAVSGHHALEIIRARRPAAAVLDWMMPGIQGPAACAALRADPDTAGIPVVMLTARAAEQDITAAFELGVTDFLTKPFAIEELEDVLRRVIDDRR